MRIRLFALALAALASLAIFGFNGAQAQGLQYFAALNGGNECNPTGTCRKGDLDAVAYGAATIILVPGTTPKVCWGITATGLSGSTVAHIHPGASGVKGAILVTLTAPSGGGNPGASSGCVAIAAGVFNQIKGNPSGFYINVHNLEFPDGAIRGQLF